MAKNFKTLLDKMSPEARKRIDEGVNEILTELDYAPTIGDTEIKELSHINTNPELDLHLARLFALHPTLKNKFNNDISYCTFNEKMWLLKQINETLGIGQVLY